MDKVRARTSGAAEAMAAAAAAAAATARDVDAQQFLRMADKFHNEMKCAICMELMEDAHTVGCGHWFCKHCALRALDVRQACPICNAEATKRQLRCSDDVDMARIVAEVRFLRDIAANYAPKQPAQPLRHHVHKQPVPSPDPLARRKKSRASSLSDHYRHHTAAIDSSLNALTCNDVPTIQMTADVNPGIELNSADPIPSNALPNCPLCLTSVVHQNNLLGPPKGPFLRGKDLVMVHRKCALWSPEVIEDPDGNLDNIDKVLNRCRTLLCALCDKPSAPLGCRRRRCRKSFHLACVFATEESKVDRVFWDEQSLSVFCSPEHTPPDFFQNGRLAYVLEDTDPGKNDDVCAICYQTGTLICCDTCPRAYHLKCHDPPLRGCPEGDWECLTCRTLHGSQVEYPEERKSKRKRRSNTLDAPATLHQLPAHHGPGDHPTHPTLSSSQLDAQPTYPDNPHVRKPSNLVLSVEKPFRTEKAAAAAARHKGQSEKMARKDNQRLAENFSCANTQPEKGARTNKTSGTDTATRAGKPASGKTDASVMACTPTRNRGKLAGADASAGFGADSYENRNNMILMHTPRPTVRTSIEYSGGREVIVLEDELCRKVPKTRASPHGTRSKKRKVILDSGLSEEQRDTLDQVAKRHGTQIVHMYTKTTTHVVVNTEGVDERPKRTPKYCTGLAAGLPIMSFGWIWSSIDEWADEELHETGHSKAMRRMVRGPFDGQIYSMGMYRGKGKNVPSRVELGRILELGGAKVVEEPVTGCVSVRDIREFDEAEANTLSSNQILEALHPS